MILPVRVQGPAATQQQPRRASAGQWLGCAPGPAAVAPRSRAAASYGASAALRQAPPPGPRPTTRAEPAHSKHESRTNQNTIFDALLRQCFTKVECDWLVKNIFVYLIYIYT